jgi:hypothetical protein
MGNPQPGSGYPTYTGYENDPWGNPRTGIGALYMGSSALDSPSATPSFTSGSCTIKENYITVCGANPSSIRFTKERLVDLVTYLPNYLSQTETYDVLKFFENYLNNLFTGTYGYTISTSAGISGDHITYNEPSNITTKKISISEKINRIVEMHDPNLIDLEYLQYYANNMGYDVNINRGELGTIASSQVGVCSAIDVEKYLRFCIENLPEWYRIKTTNNAIKVMLFSFGLIGAVSVYYTNDYSPNGIWKTPDYDMLTNSVQHIPKNFFPTSHFITWINLDKSISEVAIDSTVLKQICNSIESIRPVNTVFHSLGGYKSEQLQLNIGAQIRYRKYLKICSNGDSDYWK